MSPAERPDVTTIRLNNDERNMLKGLAAVMGVSQSDVIRMLIRNEHAARLGTKEKPKPRK